MKLSGLTKINVSRETASSVSRLILKGDPLTRREIAERVGVSVMTVGKIADALAEAGLAEDCVRAAERGRSPRVIKLPPQGIAWGILRVEESGSSLVVVGGDGKALEKQNIPYDEAMSPEDNEAMLRGRWHEVKHRIEKRFAAVGLGVILQDLSGFYWKRAILEGVGAEADLAEQENELTAKSLCGGEFGKTVLYLRLDREIRTVLAIGDEWSAGSFPIKGQKRYEELCETVLHLTDLLMPDGIVAESQGRYAGDDGRLLRRIKREWQSKRSDRPMPKLHMPDDLTLSECAMTDRLNDLLADELGRRIGK